MLVYATCKAWSAALRIVSEALNIMIFLLLFHLAQRKVKELNFCVKLLVGLGRKNCHLLFQNIILTLIYIDELKFFKSHQICI